MLTFTNVVHRTEYPSKDHLDTTDCLSSSTQLAIPSQRSRPAEVFRRAKGAVEQAARRHPRPRPRGHAHRWISRAGVSHLQQCGEKGDEVQGLMWACVGCRIPLVEAPMRFPRTVQAHPSSMRVSQGMRADGRPAGLQRVAERTRRAWTTGTPLLDVFWGARGPPPCFQARPIAPHFASTALVSVRTGAAPKTWQRWMMV